MRDSDWSKAAWSKASCMVCGQIYLYIDICDSHHDCLFLTFQFPTLCYSFMSPMTPRSLFSHRKIMRQINLSLKCTTIKKVFFFLWKKWIHLLSKDTLNWSKKWQ